MPKFKWKSNLDDYDDSDSCLGLQQILPVPPVPKDFDPSIAPTSGEEYLQHVRYEAKAFAPLLTAKRISWDQSKDCAATTIVKSKSGIPESQFAPTQEWELDQVNKFSDVRKSLHKQRMMDGADKAVVDAPDVESSVEEWTEFLTLHKPLVGTVLSLRQEQLEHVLRVFLNLMGKPGICLQLGSWLYSATAALEHPLSREACGDLRDIARKCAVMRQKKTDQEDEDVVFFNLIICIVTRYFGQVDLFQTN